MYTVLYVCTLLSLVASACGGPSVGDQVVLSLESTFGDQFAPRVSLTFSAAVTSLGALLWKPNATSSGLVSEADHAAYQQSAGSGYYRVRALHPSGAWVVGSVRTCTLAAADFVHDIVFTLDSQGGPRNIEVRPSVSAGFAGCSPGGSSAKALPAAGGAWRTRFGVVGFEDVAGPAEGAFKGTPFPGQKEISQVEVLTTQLGASGGVADEATKAALVAAAAKEAAELEKNKSWFERLQGYAMPVMIFLLLQRFLDSGKGEEKKAGAGGAAAARPAATVAGLD